MDNFSENLVGDVLSAQHDHRRTAAGVCTSAAKPETIQILGFVERPHECLGSRVGGWSV